MSLHNEFTIADARLFVNPQYPHLRASPHGIVKCECCGHGLVEIKYPHSLAEKNVTDLEDTKSFFLGKNDNGVLMLKRDH